MDENKSKVSNPSGKLLKHFMGALEWLLLAVLLISSLFVVKGLTTESINSRALFDSPLPSPTPGIFFVKATPTPRPDPILNLNFTSELMYLSLANSGVYTVGTVSNVSDEDILRFEGTDFTMFFDGSDVGLGGVDLDAFMLVDSDTILMSFDDPVTVGALGTVDDSDIVQFDATSLGSTTAGTFNWFFDGSDVELTTDSEDIDAMEVLPDGQLLVSTVGSVTVTGVSSEDEDVLIFSPTSLGVDTSGTWSIYFDGSDVGLTDTVNENVDALGVSNSGAVYLSTIGSFAVTGISGENEDVFVCIPDALGVDTACSFSSSLSFDGSLWGLAGNDVDAMDPLP